MILLIYLGIAIAIGLTSGYVLEWFKCRGWELNLKEQKCKAFAFIALEVFEEAELMLDLDFPVSLQDAEHEIFLRTQKWTQDQIEALQAG